MNFGPIITFLIFLSLFGPEKLSAQSSEKTAKNPNSSKVKQTKADNPIYTYKILNSIDNSFGYNILKDGRVIIRQTNIPGRAGNKGFERSKQAGKAAELMIQKIKSGQMPPTLSKGEIENIIH